MGRSSSVLYFINHDGKLDSWLPRWGKPTASNLRAVLTKAGKTEGTFTLVHVNGTELARVTLK